MGRYSHGILAWLCRPRQTSEGFRYEGQRRQQDRGVSSGYVERYARGLCRWKVGLRSGVVSAIERP